MSLHWGSDQCFSIINVIVSDTVLCLFRALQNRKKKESMILVFKRQKLLNFHILIILQILQTSFEIIVLIVFFVIFGFDKIFFTTFLFSYQIQNAKTFNFSIRYSQNALKIQYCYLDLIELQNAPLTYSLWFYRVKKLGAYKLISFQGTFVHICIVNT